MVYGVMNSMNARYFDVDNFLITATEIAARGASRSICIRRALTRPSFTMMTDANGWFLWSGRRGRLRKAGPHLSGGIYAAARRELSVVPRRIWHRRNRPRLHRRAPPLTKRGDWYYLMCAEGGTGYNHCGDGGQRSRQVEGPMRAIRTTPSLPRLPGEPSERHDPDHLKPQYYNPHPVLQKAGHGSMWRRRSEKLSGSSCRPSLCPGVALYTGPGNGDPADGVDGGRLAADGRAEAALPAWRCRKAPCRSIPCRSFRNLTALTAKNWVCGD